MSQTKNYTTTQSNSNAGSKADEILKWHDLYAKGIITKEEFEKQKQELLK
ncbi:MAG: SHOCT domain-containing protein [Methanosphaera sp.]|nr:SHOCT domain-containing protein [Methanosphaera sp.]